VARPVNLLAIGLEWTSERVDGSPMNNIALTLHRRGFP